MFKHAIITGVDDKERRWQYQVFIHGVHREDTPWDNLPWASFCAPFSAKQAGDLPHYEVGDTVYVSFLDGQEDKPIIMGGWITNSGDIPDVLVEQVESYKLARRRWVRSDRNGNRFIVSEIGGENHARMQSGNASVTATQNGNAVRLESKSGPIEMIAKLVSVDVDTVAVSADTYELNAEYSLLGIPLGKVSLKANDQTVLYGGILTLVGAYVPTILGVPVSTPKQALTTQIAPLASLKLGVAPGDLLSGVPLVPTQLVNMDGTVIQIAATTVAGVSAITITISGQTAVNVNSNGAVNVNGALSVNVQSQGVVSVAAPQVQLTASTLSIIGTLNFLGNINLTGNLTVAAGAVTAPIVQDIFGTKLSTHVHAYTDDGNPAVTASPTPGI